ncbi:MAG TPA: DUF2127 domain-containing protein [Candidatus Acidoferrales bacterium]|nr:DUF2127 domain-containing protein [Candidatus Acidoferrales bacterium]
MTVTRARFLRDTFRVGITLKGIDGLLETVGGVLVWLISPSSASRILLTLFHQELSEDPRDVLVAHLLAATKSLAARKWYASAFLLSHGLTKVVLVVALWFNRLWAYPLMILVLGAFVVYQAVAFTRAPSAALALLTLFDFLIIWLTSREYREQKIHGARSGSGERSSARREV